MSVDLKKLKKISQKDQDIVRGYIKQIQSSSSQKNDIGELILFVILAYYHVFEHFEKAGSCGVIYDSNRSVKHDGHSSTSAYGKLVIESIGKTTHKWVFKVNAMEI